jgi:hypothetical protein
VRAASTFLVFVTLLFGCSSKVGSNDSVPPTCDGTCKDGIAILAMRETAKLAFNLTLQGKSVGAHDETRPCPFGGTVRVFGTASSNAVQGTTEVKLTYVWDGCGYMVKDTDPKKTYNTKLAGTMTQEGILAVQPSATSAITMASDAMTWEGTVYDPPIDYAATKCPVALGQDGNALTGTICGRIASGQL